MGKGLEGAMLTWKHSLSADCINLPTATAIIYFYVILGPAGDKTLRLLVTPHIHPPTLQLFSPGLVSYTSPYFLSPHRAMSFSTAYP